jgi:hypothetical protein
MNRATELKTNPNPTPESIGVNGEKKTDVNYEDLEQGSTATPFSILFWAALKEEWVTAKAQLPTTLSGTSQGAKQTTRCKNSWRHKL